MFDNKVEYYTLELYMHLTGEHKIFSKYEIGENTEVRNKITKIPISKSISSEGYYIISILDDDGKPQTISVARAMLSTFVGSPLQDTDTADHKKSKEPLNNDLSNLEWNDPFGQRANQIRPKKYNNAFIIVYDNREQTSQQWAEEEKVDDGTILQRAQQIKNKEWSYKQYEDLPNELWKFVENSKTRKGYWMVSNLKRAAYHNKYARKVYYSRELGCQNGYPIIGYNGKNFYLHRVIFKTFKPNDFANMKPGERVLHEKDDKLDCSPDKLRSGNASMNTIDAYKNGKYDGTKRERRPCVAYKDGKQIKKFESLRSAGRWLKENGYSTSEKTDIYLCLDKEHKTAYGFIWKTK